MLMLKKTLVVFGLMLGLSACDAPQENRSTSDMVHDYSAGIYKLRSVCLDGVEYWKYNQSLSPRYSKDTKEVVLCKKEESP